MDGSDKRIYYQWKDAAGCAEIILGRLDMQPLQQIEPTASCGVAKTGCSVHYDAALKAEVEEILETEGKWSSMPVCAFYSMGGET
jgi:hypothetical protein